MTKTFDKVILLPHFQKDLKKLCKRFKTLKEDLKVFVKTELILFHKIKKDNKGVFRIPDLEIETPKIYKARKFACRSLKGKGVQSGIRVIYAYFEEEDRIELIEIYYKEDKENEDRSRILKQYRKQKK
jgi:mRNA-degrading endonuclease RelE of RelBE toxin-antitoxin system